MEAIQICYLYRLTSEHTKPRTTTMTQPTLFPKCLNTIANAIVKLSPIELINDYKITFYRTLDDVLYKTNVPIYMSR